MSMILFHNMLSQRRRLEEEANKRRRQRHESKTTNETNNKKLVNVGSICWGKHFLLDGNIYEVNRSAGKDEFAVICINIETKEEKKIRFNFKVEPINLSEQSVKDNTSVSDADFIGMSRKRFLLDKMHDAQSFELSNEEISSYFEQISLYIEANDYSAFRHMQEKHPIEPLSERQMICSQNAINCLFKKEFVQALHETLDVLSDYNKDTRLNYNEYVVLQNILTVYSHLK